MMMRVMGSELQNILIKMAYFYENTNVSWAIIVRADKDKLGEISKEDWFETLTAAGLNVNMYVSLNQCQDIYMSSD